MADDTVNCPHCGHAISMADTERYCRHTTYWGEREPVAEDCPKCEQVLYLREHVRRTWSPGKTPDECSAW